MLRAHLAHDSSSELGRTLFGQHGGPRFVNRGEGRTEGLLRSQRRQALAAREAAGGPVSHPRARLHADEARREPRDGAFGEGGGLGGGHSRQQVAERA